MNSLRCSSSHIYVHNIWNLCFFPFLPHPVRPPGNQSHEDDPVDSCDLSDALPPLLEEDPVFREAEAFEGFGNGFDHRGGSAQVTQSPLWVHVSPQLLLCDSPTCGDTVKSRVSAQSHPSGDLIVSVLHDDTDKSTKTDCAAM